MSEEMRETVEVLRLGTDLLLKVGKMSFTILQKIVAWIYKMRLNSGGEKSYKRLQTYCRERCVPVTFVNFQTEDPELLAFARENMKLMNVQFAQLPDEIRGDGKTQFMIPADQVGYFNKISESIYETELKNAQNENRQPRMKSGDVEVIDNDEAVNAVMPDSAYNQIKTDMLANAHTPSTPEAVLNAAQQREYKMQIINGENCVVKSVNKEKLLTKLPEGRCKVKIPGRQDSYFIIDKPYCLEEDKKTMVIAIRKDAAYEVFGKNNDIVRLKGDDIIKYFDRPWDIRKGTTYPNHRTVVPQIHQKTGR